MNAQLTQAMEAAQRLPEDFQSAIATLIWRISEEQEKQIKRITRAASRSSDHLQEAMEAIEVCVREIIARRKLKENSGKEKVSLLNEQLEQALEKVRLLSVDRRGAIVDGIWRALSEREWQTLVNQPHIQQQLHNLCQQALTEEGIKEEEIFDAEWAYEAI